MKIDYIAILRVHSHGGRRADEAKNRAPNSCSLVAVKNASLHLVVFLTIRQMYWCISLLQFVIFPRRTYESTSTCESRKWEFSVRGVRRQPNLRHARDAAKQGNVTVLTCARRSRSSVDIIDPRTYRESAEAENFVAACADVQLDSPKADVLEENRVVTQVVLKIFLAALLLCLGEGSRTVKMGVTKTILTCLFGVRRRMLLYRRHKSIFVER